jgi:MoxR-like ATPase
MDIIAKKVRRFYANHNGLIMPLFEILPSKELRVIEEGEFPNAGSIFVSDYELLNSDVTSDIFSIDNGFFISDDNSFADKRLEPNACQKRINYNSGIRNYFRSVPPTRLIPVYLNDFRIQDARVKVPDNITSQFFFLKDPVESKVFGPFERDNFDLKAARFKDYEDDYDDDQFKDFVDEYSEFDGAVVSGWFDSDLKNFLISDSQGNEYIIDFTSLFGANNGELIEFTPIPLLHQWAINKISFSSKPLYESIKDAKNLDIHFNTTVDQLRWSRYLEILEKIDEGELPINNLIEIIQKKGFLNEITESTEIGILRKELSDLQETLSVKNDEIIKLKDEREEIIQKVESSEKEQDSIDPELYPNLSKLLKENERFKEVEAILHSHQSHESLSDDIKNLRVRKEILDEDIKKLEESERKVTESVRLIKQSFDNDVTVHTAKLADAKMYSDLLNGININLNEKENDRTEEPYKLLKLTPELGTAKNFIAEIQKRLKIHGRDFNFNEVANLIITINQSFLTIIAGAPGVGKTSIVEKLSKTYGLASEFGYLEINCARGWTSSKDLLGFYNPLTGRYQQSKTRLKDALENSSKNTNAPYIVLLDEANLSPIEHYWSDFIKLADHDYERVVKVSDKEQIHFGEGFRFVATINYDHTTETLSNRLLDRAPILQLERSTIINDVKVAAESLDQIFDFNDVQKLFIETPRWKSDEELIKQFLTTVKERIEANNSGILISPRKELAVRRYCKVATGLLEGNSYTALDYALAQHILPLINGRGEQFESMLKLIKNDLNDKGMIKSERLLNKILDKGKDFKHFKYNFY